MSNHRMTFTAPASQIRIAKILALLEREPMNTLAIANALPMSRRWVRDYMLYLRDTNRVHIIRWDKQIAERKKRHAIEVWAAGAGENAPRPPQDTMAERSKAAWERIKSDEDKHDKINAMRRVRARIKAKRPEIATSWITPVANETDYRRTA